MSPATQPATRTMYHVQVYVPDDAGVFGWAEDLGPYANGTALPEPMAKWWEAHMKAGGFKTRIRSKVLLA